MAYNDSISPRIILDFNILCIHHGMKRLKNFTQLNRWLALEFAGLIISTAYLAANWNKQTTVGTNAIGLLWVEIVWLIYLNLKERE